MNSRVLITGAAGFAGTQMGRYLADLEPGVKVVGVDVVEFRSDYYDEVFSIDLTSAEEADRLIREVKPERVIHLAGSFGTTDDQEIYRINVLSMTSLMQAAARHVPGCVVVAAGSSAEYGRPRPEQVPLKESSPCHPIMVYGLSKLLATKIALYYWRVHQLCTMVVRPFQLIGKGVTSRLAPGSFALQIRQAMAEGGGVIEVGTLESYRDFLDVHDGVRGIWRLCENPAPGEIFNLCSGHPTKIGDLLDLMIIRSGVAIDVREDSERLRVRREIPVIYGSYDKLRDHCGWRPEVPLDQSISAMFAD